MRSPFLVVLALPLAILAAGFGAGYLTGRTTAPAGPEAVGARQERVRSGEAAAPEALAGPDAPLASRRRATEARAATGLVDADAERLARAALDHATHAAAEPEAPAEITGTVRLQDGSPAAGATVVASVATDWRSRDAVGRDTSDLGRAWDGFGSLEEDLAATASATLRKRATSAVAQTDADGSFRLPVEAGEAYALMPHLADHLGESVTARGGASVELVMAPVGRFHVEPRLPDGSVPDSAVVAVVSGSREDPVRWTRDDPIVRLSERGATLRVLAGEVARIDHSRMGATFESEARIVNLDVDGDGPHVFELEPKTLVKVDLRLEGGAVKGLEPWVELALVGDDAKPQRPDAKPQRLRAIGIDTYGARSVALGRYELTAGRGQGEAEASQTVEVVAGLNRFAIELGALDPERFLAVRCIDDEGRPVTGVNFHIETTYVGGGTRSFQPRSVQRPGGIQWLELASRVDVIGGPATEPAEYEVEARSQLYGTQRRTVTSTDETLVFEFVRPAEATIEVVGDWSEGLSVSMAPEGAGDFDPFRQPRGFEQGIPKDGLVKAPPLQPGDYTLKLLVRQSAGWNGTPLVEESIRLRSGPSVHRVILPRLHGLVVALEGDTSKARLSMAAEGPSGPSFGGPPIDDAGRVTFDRVPAGRYRLTLWNDGKVDEMLVSVPSGPVTFRAGTPSGLVIQGLQEKGLLVDAGARVGDVVLGFGEHEATSRTTFMKRLEAALMDGDVRLRVERGGRTIELELPQTEVVRYDTLGAQWVTRLE